MKLSSTGEPIAILRFVEVETVKGFCCHISLSPSCEGPWGGSSVGVEGKAAIAISGGMGDKVTSCYWLHARNQNTHFIL